MLSPRNFALALLAAIIIFGLLAGNELGLREEARTAAAKFGQSCVSLSDPTVGANPMPEEHRLLRSADPDGKRYFLSHRVLVTPLSGSVYRGCFGRQISSNPVGTNVIFLNLDRLSTPALRATALSHELIHVEHGDPTAPLGQHTFLQHLWQPEEAEAHLRGLRTARALRSPAMYPVWQDRLIWIDTLPIFYGLIAADLTLFGIAFRASPRKRRKPSPSLGWRPAGAQFVCRIVHRGERRSASGPFQG